MNWWSAVFAINYIFQLFRGDKQDIAIFTLAFVLMLLEGSGYLNRIPTLHFLQKRRFNSWLIVVFALIVAPLKRGSEITFSLFIILFLYLFAALWRSEDGDLVHLSDDEIEITWRLSLVAIAICVWEVISFALAEQSKSDYLHPTISVLIAPHIAEGFGRFVFILLWVATGMLLLKDWAKRP